MDTIADFITIIRNGYMAKKDTVVAKYTVICEEIAKLLKAEGFIVDYSVENTKPSKKLILTLRYFDKDLPPSPASNALAKAASESTPATTKSPKLFRAPALLLFLHHKV